MDILLSYRPEKPLDGVIVTVTAQQLNGESQSAGALLNQVLWQIQKASGFNLPVYLLVDNCESLNGFNGFCAELSEAQKQQIFGWSNGNKLDTAFDENWATEAITQVSSQLQNAQLSIAGTGQVIEDTDGFVLFPNAFKSLLPPLVEYLRLGFKATSYQEAQPLRGIYFCGKDPQKNQQHASVFVEDVINKKVFVEQNLGRPVSHVLFSRQPQVKRLQKSLVALAVVAVFGVLADTGRLIYNEQRETRLMTELAASEVDCDAAGQSAQRLLMRLADAASNPIYPTLPLSWFARDPQEQSFVAQDVLSSRLFPALECRLKAKAEKIKQRMIAQNQTQHSYKDNIRQLQDFADAVHDYYQNRDIFIKLSGALPENYPSANNLLTLYHYSFQSKLPADIHLDKPMFNHALQQMRYRPSMDLVKTPLVSRAMVKSFLETRSTALQQQLQEYATSPWRKALSELSAQSLARETTQPLPVSAMPPLIDRALNWFAQTRDDWQSGYPQSPCFALSERIGRFISTLHEAGYETAGMDGNQQLFNEQNCYQRVQQSLLASKLDTGEALYELTEPVAGQSVLVSSEALLQFQSQLTHMKEMGFLQQEFPVADESTESPLGWNLATLRQTQQLLTDYQDFVARFPNARVQSRIKQRAEQASYRLLSNARLYASGDSYQKRTVEQSLVIRVDNLEQVKSTLLQLQQLLKQLEFNITETFFRDTLHKQLHQVLTELNELVAEQQLYGPTTVPDWQQENFAWALYKSRTDKQTQTYLQAQQERLSWLSYRYAQPVLTTLLNLDGRIHQEQAVLWQDTLHTFEQVTNKVPNNPQAMLDEFIAVTLPQLSNDNCYNQNLTANSWVAGWHGQRLAQLSQLVQAQCQGAIRSNAAQDFLDLAQAFNQLLAGRFPFAPVEKAGKLDVTLPQLRQFIDIYQAINGRDTKQDLVKRITRLTERYPAEVPPGWLDYITSLHQFMEFVQPRLNDDGLAVDLAVQFTPHATQGAEQILRWSVTNDKQQARFPNGDTEILWQTGQPLKLAMRWAKGSPYQPSAAGVSDMQVDLASNTVTVSTRGNWGLFEWMARYSEPSELAHGYRKLWFYPKVTAKPETQVDGNQSKIITVPTSIALAANSANSSKPGLDTIPLLLPHSAPALFGGGHAAALRGGKHSLTASGGTHFAVSSVNNQ